MAIAFTELESGANTANQQVYTTGSFTLDENELILVFTENGKAGSPGTVTVTGHSLTWASIATETWDEDFFGTSTGRLTAFRAMKGTAGTSTGTLTLTVSGTDNLDISWVVVRVTGVATGSNGATAVVQSDADDGTGTSFSTSLAAFANSANGTIAAFAYGRTSGTITPEAGYSASTQVTHTNSSLRAQWFAGVDRNPSASVSSSENWAGVSIELSNATPAGSATPRAYGMVA